MKQKKNILVFILAISISLIAFGCTYNIVGGKSLQTNFISLFIINLPLGIAIGFLDLGIINMTYKRFKGTRNTIRILVDLIVTTLLGVLISFSMNSLLSDANVSIGRLLENTLPVIPWNWTIVLLIEIFFYSLRQTEIEKEKALYQFKILKNQMNPHFLFNSLNVLASLAYQDAEKTNLFAKRLSSIYRYLLTTQEQSTVTLEEELRFVESYLYLEDIRFGETLRVCIENDKRQQNKVIIPASLQMLVENALKHNISTSKSPLTIHITITADGVTVSNNVQLRSCVTKNGTGLKNLQSQYSLYGRTVEVSSENSLFTVKIPFID